MHSTKRLWTPEASARKHLKLGPSTILAIMRHGCSILTATISRSFIKAESMQLGLRMAPFRDRWMRTLRGVNRSPQYLADAVPRTPVSSNASNCWERRRQACEEDYILYFGSPFTLATQEQACMNCIPVAASVRHAQSRRPFSQGGAVPFLMMRAACIRTLCCCSRPFPKSAGSRPNAPPTYRFSGGRFPRPLRREDNPKVRASGCEG